MLDLYFSVRWWGIPEYDGRAVVRANLPYMLHITYLPRNSPGSGNCLHHQHNDGKMFAHCHRNLPTESFHTRTRRQMASIDLEENPARLPVVSDENLA